MKTFLIFSNFYNNLTWANKNAFISYLLKLAKKLIKSNQMLQNLKLFISACFYIKVFVMSKIYGQPYFIYYIQPIHYVL